MEVVLIVIGLAVVAIFFIFRSALRDSSRGFDDPQLMSNHHLLSAISGQADWLEKVMQNCVKSGFKPISPEIKKIESDRRTYIARLCSEVISRGLVPSAENQHPGAILGLNPFADVAIYAKKLETSGIPESKAALRAVKEKLFKENGHAYRAPWEE